MNDFASARKQALIIGIAGLALCGAGAILSPQQFLRSYLVGYLFWIGVALGAFALVMLHHLTGGNWGLIIRRYLESATRTIPVLALLILPLLLGVPYLYEWAHADVVAKDAALQTKSAYLNVPFFIGRTVAYFAIWFGLAFLLNKWSAEHDRTGDPAVRTRFQALSGPGLILYGLTVTFAAVDWVMSLEPHWFSTIYGVLFMIGQVLSTLACAIVLTRLLQDREPLKGVLAPAHFHDLGNLMLAFVMLWAYVSFSQYLIIWSGNLPEETPWYLRRFEHGWKWVGVALLLFHFAVPFIVLLSRQNKRRIDILARLAGAMIFMRLVDLFWITQPAFEGGLRVHWMDVAAPVGIGGVWIAVFLAQLKSRPLLPVHEVISAGVEHG